MQFLVFYTTFKYFFSNGATVETTGEIFEKLKLAVEYNGSAPPKKGEATNIQKSLSNLSDALSKNHRQNGIVAYKSLDNAQKTLNQQLQTDRLSTETLKRFENILYGPHAGAFCQIMDLFVSGYGKLDIDNDVLCVRLIFEEKIKFWKKFISPNHVSSVRASYEAQNVSNQHHSSLQFLFHQKVSEQYKYKISHTIKSLVFEKGWYLSNSYTVWIL